MQAPACWHSFTSEKTDKGAYNHEKERQELETIDSLFNSKKLKDNWQWRTVYKTKTISINDSDLQLVEEDIFKNLNEGLRELLKKEEKIAIAKLYGLFVTG